MRLRLRMIPVQIMHKNITNSLVNEETPVHV